MAALMPQGKQQYFTAGGIPLVGGKVYTYAAGTTTPLATYTDAAAGTPNTNPVILDSRGEASIFFSAANYKIVVKDSLDSTIWTQDNLPGDQAATILANLAASTGSSLVGHIASGTGAVATTVQAKLRESVSVLDFGAVPNLTTVGVMAANSVAIQAAFTYAASAGVLLDLTTGTFSYDTTLIIPNGISIYGSGKTKTLLRYTGASDAIQINNPINSSTAANIHLSDFSVTVTTRTDGKACIADTGSTFLTMKGLGLLQADRLLILDQSELVDISLCDFELAADSKCAIWIVNGPDRTVGSAQYFTNRISVYWCQFNGAAGAEYAIADDGGTSHHFICNNFNGIPAFRIAGVRNLSITQSEIETFAPFYFQLTRLNGTAGGLASTGINISDNFCTAPTNGIQFTAGSCNDVTFRNNAMHTGAGVYPIANAQTNCVRTWHGSGNVQSNFGVGYTDNMLIGNNENCERVAFNSVWSSAGTQPSLGNGTLEAYFTRNGNRVYVDLLLTAGSTTTFGTGIYYFALPSSVENNLPMLPAFVCTGTGKIIAGGVASTFNVERASNTLVQMIVNGIGTSAVGPTYPGTFASGETISMRFEYICTSSLVSP